MAPSNLAIDFNMDELRFSQKLTKDMKSEFRRFKWGHSFLPDLENIWKLMAEDYINACARYTKHKCYLLESLMILMTLMNFSNFANFVNFDDLDILTTLMTLIF